MAHVFGVPVYSGIIKSEIELHAVLLSQAAEHIDEVYRRHIAAFLQKIWRRIGDELTIAATDVDNCVDTDCLHICKILVPFLLAPVLMRNVMRNLIKECSCDS